MTPNSVKVALVCLGLIGVYYWYTAQPTVTLIDQGSTIISFKITGSPKVLDLSKCGGLGQTVVVYEEYDDVVFRPIFTKYKKKYHIECFDDAKDLMTDYGMSFQHVLCNRETCEATLVVPSATPVALQKIRVLLIHGIVSSIEPCEIVKSNSHLSEMNCTEGAMHDKEYTGFACVQIGEQKCVSNILDRSTNKIHTRTADPDGYVHSAKGIVGIVLKDTTEGLDYVSRWLGI